MNGMEITLPEDLPIVDWSREFSAPSSAVFSAHTDGDLYRQWIGPRDLTTRIDMFEMRPGGRFRFVQHGNDDVEHAFRGMVHQVRQDELIIETFEYEGYPDVVSLEFTWFEDLPGGRSLVRGRSVYASLEERAVYVDGGMEYGMREGYERLEELLAAVSRT